MWLDSPLSIETQSFHYKFCISICSILMNFHIHPPLPLGGKSTAVLVHCNQRDWPCCTLMQARIKLCSSETCKQSPHLRRCSDKPSLLYLLVDTPPCFCLHHLLMFVDTAVYTQTSLQSSHTHTHTHTHTRLHLWCYCTWVHFQTDYMARLGTYAHSSSVK